MVKGVRLTSGSLRARLLAFSMVASMFGLSGVLPGVTPVLGAAPPTPGCGVVPLDVELIIDRSDSMGSSQWATGTPPHSRLYWSQAAADDLVGALDANGGVGGSGRHHVGLTTFGNNSATVDLALGTSSASAAVAAVDGIADHGNTPFKLGMAAGAGDMSAHRRTTADGLDVEHVIIILSDGHPSSGYAPSLAEIAAFKASADVVYSVAVGAGGTGTDEVDVVLMQALASDAAHFHHVVDGSDLPSLFSDIFGEIACQPAISIAKTPSRNSLPSTGGSVTYTYAVTNPGDVALTDVAVSDDKCAPVAATGGDANSNSALDPGETWTFACDADLSVTTTNTATATALAGDAPVSAQAQATVTVAAPSPSSSVGPSVSPSVSPSEAPSPSAAPVSPSPTSTVGGATATPHVTLPPTSTVDGGPDAGAGSVLSTVLVMVGSGLLGLAFVTWRTGRRSHPARRRS